MGEDRDIPAENPVDDCGVVFPAKQVPEVGVECCNSTRRHGRFLVQQMEEGIKARSPVCKPRASPGIRSVLSERRPSRIIGRFEVSELFPCSVDSTAPSSIIPSASASPVTRATTHI